MKTQTAISELLSKCEFRLEEECSQSFNRLNQERIIKLLVPLLKAASAGPDLKQLAEKSLLRHFFWNATAFDNNSMNAPYSGQPYWTRQAVLQYLSNAKVNFGKRHSGLRHEHAVPIKLLKEKAWEKPYQVGDLILQFSRAVVVTIKEDDQFKKHGLNDRMPIGFDWKSAQIFQRYEKAKVGPILDVRKSPELWELLTCNKKRFSELSNSITVIA